MISYYNNFVVLVLFGSSAAFAGDMRLPAADTLHGFWWLVLLGGLAQTGIYFFYYRNLKHYEVWVVKLYLLLMPVVSCFIGVLFLGEELTLKKTLGILVVLLGAAVILLRSRLHREEALCPMYTALRRLPHRTRLHK
jgi:drug/metabolite transporter (DMT)-like permease